MTEFQNKSFSVYPGAVGTQQYRDNYDRIFGKKKDEPVEEPVPDTIPELKSPAEDIYCPDGAARGITRVIPREGCINPNWCGYACNCD